MEDLLGIRKEKNFRKTFSNKKRWSEGYHFPEDSYEYTCGKTHVMVVSTEFWKSSTAKIYSRRPSRYRIKVLRRKMKSGTLVHYFMSFEQLSSVLNQEERGTKWVLGSNEI